MASDILVAQSSRENQSRDTRYKNGDSNAALPSNLGKYSEVIILEVVVGNIPQGQEKKNSADRASK